MFVTTTTATHARTQTRVAGKTERSRKVGGELKEKEKKREKRNSKVLVCARKPRACNSCHITSSRQSSALSTPSQCSLRSLVKVSFAREFFLGLLVTAFTSSAHEDQIIFLVPPLESAMKLSAEAMRGHQV